MITLLHQPPFELRINSRGELDIANAAGGGRVTRLFLRLDRNYAFHVCNAGNVPLFIDNTVGVLDGLFILPRPAGESVTRVWLGDQPTNLTIEYNANGLETRTFGKYRGEVRLAPL